MLHVPVMSLRSADSARSRAAVLVRVLDRQADEQAGQVSTDGRRNSDPLPEEPTPREHALLTAPHGSWDAKTIEQVFWEREALGVLGWTLGWLASLPPYDTGFRSEDVLAAYSPDHLTAQVQYARPESAIRVARDLAEAWHWRIRTRVFEDQILKQGIDPVEVVREAAQYLHEHAGLVVVDDDYSAYDKPFRDLTIEEFDLVTNVAFQRHRTLNWLCGLTKSWDDTSLTT